MLEKACRAVDFSFEQPTLSDPKVLQLLNVLERM
jgi:hypothetical protein